MTSSTPSALAPLQPTPISWPPSQYWEDAGGWSSFALQVGNPPQVARVLVSTAGHAPWVISNLACSPDLSPSCSEFRGGVFNSDDSRTWNQLGYFALDIETNLSPPDNATYGFETVALGLTNVTGGPVLENQVVAALSGTQYALGTVGLNQEPTNLSVFTDPHPSFLTTLYSKKLIPSLSWSYTAGAKYRLKGVFGSLTLGGYDAARFTPSNISFDFATDISRDLVVGLQSITSTESNDSTHLLLPSAHTTFIDSTVSCIYLPLDACKLFERVYGLVWNATYEMYLVDDALHDSLVTRSPSFTFELGNSKIGGSTVKITLPYDSFDLSFLPDVDAAPLRYFPIQRAANDSQLTLGRTFLQEAYLITDYQHRNFSVSQCVFDEPIEQKIVPILSENTTMTADTVPTSSSINVAHKAAHLELQKIVGISVGAAIGFLVLLTLSCWPFIARHQRRFGSKARASGSFPYAIQHEFHVDHKSTQSSPDSSTPHLRSQSGINATSHKNVAEIGTNSWNFLREVADNGKIELPENPNLYELSQENRTATSEARTSRTRIPQTRLNPGRRRGLIVSNDDHRLTLGGLRLSRTEPAPSTERSDADLSLRSYLSSKSLPATPISESPQESAFPTWVRVAKHQHEGKGSDAPPLRFPENPFQHRRGFF